MQIIKHELVQIVFVIYFPLNWAKLKDNRWGKNL